MVMAAAGKLTADTCEAGHAVALVLVSAPAMDNRGWETSTTISGQYKISYHKFFSTMIMGPHIFQK